MRDRAWRRHIEEVYIIRRLKKSTWGNRWFFEDINRNRFKKLLIVDFLEKNEYFLSKCDTTNNWSSKNKDKYSPNRCKNGWWRTGDSYKTREWNRRFFLKILKENGLK